MADYKELAVTRAEQAARDRIKAAGNMPPDGIKVGSDLHLCEMLLGQLDEARNALTAQAAALTEKDAEIDALRKQVVALREGLTEVLPLASGPSTPILRASQVFAALPDDLSDMVLVSRSVMNAVIDQIDPVHDELLMAYHVDGEWAKVLAVASNLLHEELGVDLSHLSISDSVAKRVTEIRAMIGAVQEEK